MSISDSDIVIHDTVILPDNSAFFTASMPLPSNHWLYAAKTTEWDSLRDCIGDLPSSILTHESRADIIKAAKFAIRAVTNCGKEMDFDPDALVQTLVVAICGQYEIPISK